MKSIWNFYNFNLMIEPGGESTKIDYSDPISRRLEIATRCRVRALRRHLCVASCVWTFSPVPWRMERKLSAGSVGYSTYLYLVYSADFCAAASGRKLTCTVFRQATKTRVTIDHEFIGNSTSPPFAIVSYPSHTGISLPLGKRLQGCFRIHMGAKIPVFFSYTNANVV